MPSQSLMHWRQAAAEALDRMESAHRAIGGTARGRRHATQQINQSYLMLLSSHFQRFCRSLHSEAVAHIVGNVDAALKPVVQASLTLGRTLDRGNPNPGNLGADFGRVGDRVRFRLGARDVAGTLIEDLGKIGIAGQRLDRVEVPLDATYLQAFEIPTALLTPVPRRRAA